MKVIILAGGLGTRISEETADKPKPMVLLNDKPILWHIMSIFAQQGHPVRATVSDLGPLLLPLWAVRMELFQDHRVPEQVRLVHVREKA